MTPRLVRAVAACDALALAWIQRRLPYYDGVAPLARAQADLDAAYAALGEDGQDQLRVLLFGRVEAAKAVAQ